MLMALGLLRLGFLANLLSHPVIAGFIAASSVLIAVSQLKHLLGIDLPRGTVDQILWALATNLGDLNWATAAVGLASVGLLFWVRKGLGPILKGRIGLSQGSAAIIVRAAPVVVVILATVAVIAFNLDTARGVSVVGVVPSGLPPLALPDLDIDLIGQLAPAAALIALVGFVESISVAQALAAKRRERVDPNQELVGIGAANVAAGVTGGYPVTGGFARSGVNFAAGARTPLAGVFTAILIGVTALALTPAFERLPNAVLAATIIVAVLSLIDLPHMIHTLRYSLSDGAAMLATIAGVLFLGIEAGILIGLGLSLALYIYRTSRPHMAVVGRVPGTEHYRNIDRHDVITRPDVLAVRVDESLYFANARYLEDRVMALVAERPAVKRVVLICSAVNLIDASALDSLEALNHRLNEAGVTFDLAEVKGPVMDRLADTHFLKKLTGQVHLTTHGALAEDRAQAAA
jgi:SulP family sulfate permease